MTNLIIIEGPDGAGKTTLANHLADAPAPDIHVRHPHTRKATHLERLHSALELTSPHSWHAAKRARRQGAFSPRSRLVVTDRYEVVSDTVYSQVFGRAGTWNQDDVYGWLLELRWDVVVIQCKGNPDKPPPAPTGDETEEEWRRLVHYHPAVCEAYNNLEIAKWTGLPVLRYDRWNPSERWWRELCATVPLFDTNEARRYFYDRHVP